MLEKEMAKFDDEEAGKSQLFQRKTVEPTPKQKPAIQPAIVLARALCSGA
jgi:hypothetical protein